MSNKYEDLLAAQLDEAGIEYVREYQFHPTRKWRHDFYLPKYNIAIEVDGISYRGQGGRHQTGQGFQQDCVKCNESLIVGGIRLLKFTPALINGKAKDTRKNAPRIEPAIDTIKRLIDSGHCND